MGVGTLILVVAVVAGGLGVAFGPPAALAAAILAALAIATWVRVQGRRVLRLAGARRIGAGEWPRLSNLVTGLARRSGSPTPELWVTSRGGRNALVSRVRGRGCVAVSREFLELASRTELEAVAAHCIGRLQRDRLVAEALVAAFGGWLPLGRPIVGTADDVRAAELTRYPPALATALRTAGAAGRLPAFWFAADAPSHEPRARRLALLADL